MNKNINCPVCKSKRYKDISAFADNNISGPGYASWKILHVYKCLDCGVHYSEPEKE